MWWKKNHQEADNPIYSLFIPFDQIMFFPSSPSFFYSFLSRFVFVLVQSSPIANDDLCWRFCCCHTKLVHSERFRNFRYYFFVLWDFKASITEKKGADMICTYLNNTSSRFKDKAIFLHASKEVCAEMCGAFFISLFSQFLIC